MFGKPLKLFWAMLALAAIAIELVPAHYPAGVFVTQTGLRPAFSSLLGYLAPMAFWRFSYLTASILASASSAILVELIQAMVAHGHRFQLGRTRGQTRAHGAGFVALLTYVMSATLRRDRIRPAARPPGGART